MSRIHVTEAESEVLAALWRKGPLSFYGLIETVQERQDWAGATIKTLLNRLMRKELVRSIREDGRQLYHPQVSRETFVRNEITALADRFYGGDEGALLKALRRPAS